MTYLKESKDVVLVNSDYYGSRRCFREMAERQCLVIHGMLEEYVRAVMEAPPEILVFWSGWGFDFADLLEPQLGPLLLPESRRLYAKVRSLERFTRDYRGISVGDVRRKAMSAIRRVLDKRHPLVKVASRLDLFYVTPGESELVRRAIPQLRAKFHLLHYVTTEDTLASGPVAMSGADILVGNSATATNNHVEAFEILARIGVDGRKIVVPLSYGSRPYADEICRIGERKFGKSFMGIREFLPLGDYLEAIRGCGTVVMNHRRQQAVGTYSAALYKGAKVFLREENPMFGFYRDIGVTLSGFEELTRRESLEPLHAGAKRQNREILGAFWSRRGAIDCIRQIESFVPRAGAVPIIAKALR